MSLLFSTYAIAPILGARGRAIQKLLEGDPVAWTILAVVVGIMILISIAKAVLKKGGTDEGPPRDEG
jgi:hypothetical protein